MARFLISGVAGFIGSSLARHLLASGEEVRGVDNFSTGRRQNIADLLDRLELHTGDLSQPGVAAAACQDMDFVLHQAAIPSVPRSMADPLESNQANLDATVQLLVAARAAGVRRVVYAASSAAYGESPVLPKREDAPPQPISPYAVAKLAGEYYMRCFHAVYGLPTVSLRYFNVFGPRQDPHSPYAAVLAKFISQMLAGQPPTIYGDGEQSRDFTYVDNVVQANLLACRAPAETVAGQVFNIALGQGISLNEIVALLRPLTGYAGPTRHEAPRAGDIKHSLADIARARQSLHYGPLVSFEEGLRRTVAWYRQKQP